MDITSSTSVLGVVGKPVKHSLSPKIHNYLSKKLGLDYVYVAFEPDDISSVLKAVKDLGIRGINITAPYKYDAYNLVDVKSDSAIASGSVNTVVNNNGVLTGYSTDGEGLHHAMATENICIENKNVILLGAGGAAEPVCVMLHKYGATKVSILNRTTEKAQKLADNLNARLNTDIFSVYKKGDVCEMIINTTSVGMGTDENCLSMPELLENAETAIDIIYHPRETAFLRMSHNAGLKTMNGLGMLVSQAVLAFEYFTGVKVSYELYQEVLNYINE